MGAVRIVILVVAAVAAIGLALVVRQMAGAHRPAPIAVAAPAAPTVQVLTARRDLPVGTHITPADLAWKPFPPEAVSREWMTNGPVPTGGVHLGPAAAHADTNGSDAMQAVSGAYVHEPIFEGEPILDRQIVRAGAGGFMSVALQPGMRAVALPVTPETGVGGFVLPGDRVDVVLTRKTTNNGGGGPGGGGDQPAAVAETILRDIRVLGVDQQSQAKAGSNAMVAASVTLEVPAGDVETLLAAKGRGELALDLRSYADISGQAGRDGPTQGNSVRFIRAGQVSEASAP